MEKKKAHKFFMQGPIDPQFIADSIAKHSSKTSIGAHSIFLGQVRNDLMDGKEVVAIEYEVYEEMATPVLAEVREALFSQFDLSCVHIHHSTGRVEKGQICLFVFVSSKHRAAATEACKVLVDDIKAKIPIFGKEIFADESYVWKVNKS